MRTIEELVAKYPKAWASAEAVYGDDKLQTFEYVHFRFVLMVDKYGVANLENEMYRFSRGSWGWIGSCVITTMYDCFTDGRRYIYSITAGMPRLTTVPMSPEIWTREFTDVTQMYDIYLGRIEQELAMAEPIL